MGRGTCRSRRLVSSARDTPFGPPWWVIQLTSMPCTCSIMSAECSNHRDTDELKDYEGEIRATGCLLKIARRF